MRNSRPSACSVSWGWTESGRSLSTNRAWLVQSDGEVSKLNGEREFYVACVECGEDLEPGDAAIAATTGTIAVDGGFYMEDSEPWLWVRHAPNCQSPLRRTELKGV